MKRLLIIFFAAGLIITAKAQTTETENTVLQIYQVQISGATDIYTAKELGTYDYMEQIFFARPTFDDETNLFTIKSYELITIEQLISKLNENGLTVISFNQSIDYSQPK